MIGQSAIPWASHATSKVVNSINMNIVDIYTKNVKRKWEFKFAGVGYVGY